MLTTKKIAGIGILGAVVIVLQLLSNYVSFGPVSITLALIPIVIGAIIYGPLAGLILGMIDGAIVIAAPSTMVFLDYNVAITILLCLFKTGIAGLVAGFMPMIFKKHDKVGVILASIITPIINTGIFVLVSLGFFMNVEVFKNPTPEFLIFTVVGINFIIEFAVNAVLSPTIYYLINVIKNKIINKGI